MKDDKQTKAQSRNQKIKHWFRRHYKKLIVILAVVLVALITTIILAGGSIEKYITQTFLRGGSENTLLSSLENTLKLEQIKFHTELSKQSSEKSPYRQTLKVDGVYKKGAGLSAATDSTVDSMGIKLSQKSRWVIDASGSTYVNLQSYGTETTADSPIKNTPAMDQITERIVKNNNKKNKDAWTKYDGDHNLRGTYSLTGLQGCALKMYYNIQSNPQAFLGLVSHVTDGLKIQKTATDSGMDTYAVTALSSRYGDIGGTYKGNDLYKWLVGCNSDEYSATDESINSILKALTMTVKVDTAKKLISSLSVKSKDAFDFSATFSPASDVDISVPKNPEPVMTPSNITLEKIKEEYPHDYEHIAEAADSTIYGVCHNLEKYKAYAPPEAIEICANAPQRN